MKTFLKQRNNISVTILSLAILVIAFWGFLSDYLLFMVVGICFALAMYSWRTRDTFDTKLYGGIGLIYLGSRFIFTVIDDQYLILRTSAILAFVLLHIVLLIGPWSRFSVWVRKQYTHRRHLGVAVFFLGALHAAIAYRTYVGSFEGVITGIFTFFGFITLYIFAILALTSRDHVQSHFSNKAWYIIHTAAILGMAYFISLYFQQQTDLMASYGGFFAVTLPIIFIIFGFIVAPYSLAHLFFFQVNGWKQVHVLIYIAYVALLFHAWVGVGAIQPLWIQSLIWGSFLVVVISHAFGWCVKWQEDNYFRNRVKKLNTSTIITGKTYIGIARIDEFTPMKGEKFIVNNVPIAVFLCKGQYKAISTICAHQKGPLYQGLLTAAGYVICPWHQYTFSVKDGKGPPGYTDRIPVYQTLVKDGIVYVSVI